MTEAVDRALAEDKVEGVEHPVLESSLHLFSNIKGSFNRCICFSNTKALYDLHNSFKNVMRYYAKGLRKRGPK